MQIFFHLASVILLVWLSKKAFKKTPSESEILLSLSELKKIIMANQKEVAEALTTITAQVVKIGTETAGLQTKVAELEAAIANAGEVSQEVTDALDALKTQVQSVDDLVADVTPTDEPTE